MALKTVDLTQQLDRATFSGTPEEEINYAKTFWQSLQLLPPMESRLVSSDIKQRLRKAPPSCCYSESAFEPWSGYYPPLSFGLSNRSCTLLDESFILNQDLDQKPRRLELCSSKPELGLDIWNEENLSGGDGFVSGSLLRMSSTRGPQGGIQKAAQSSCGCSGKDKGALNAREESNTGDSDYIIFELGGEDLCRGRGGKYNPQDPTIHQQPLSDDFIECGGEDLCRHHGRLQKTASKSKGSVQSLFVIEEKKEAMPKKRHIVIDDSSSLSDNDMSDEAIDVLPPTPRPSLCSNRCFPFQYLMDPDVDVECYSSADAKNALQLEFAARNFKPHIGRDKKLQETENRPSNLEPTSSEAQHSPCAVEKRIGVQYKCAEPLLLFIPGCETIL